MGDVSWSAVPLLKIAPDVHFMSREEWGARTDLPRLGTLIPADVPTEAIQHHTVIIDQDATPNRWESVAEVIVKMQQLQTIRPDLGRDVPYSYVCFLMQYPHKIGLILCEGRGPYRRGAHTMYHNVEGRAMAIEGNTEIGLPIDPYVPHLSYAWGWIKDEYGLVNLGSVVPDRGGIVHGHIDFRRDDDRRTWTACPGKGMMAVIDQLTLTRWTPEPELALEDDDMAAIIKVSGSSRTYLVRGGPPVHIPSRAIRDELQRAFEIRTAPQIVSQETFDFLNN